MATYSLECIPRGRSRSYECPELPETEWAYIAGILDGEGCITYNQNQRGRRYPKISIGNTHQGLVEWLRMVLGGSTYYQDRSDRPGWSDCWLWVHSSGAAVYAILSKCLPYLLVKRDVALGALNILESRGISTRV